MPPKERKVLQNLIDENSPPIRVQDDVSEAQLTKETFDELFEGCSIPRRVGLAPAYTPNASLSHLVVATAIKAMVIQFAAKGKEAKAYAGRQVLSTEVLCNPDVTLVAFDLSKLAIQLFTDQGIRILNGVDLQSAFGRVDRSPLDSIKFAVREQAEVFKDNVEAVFTSSTLDPKRTTSFVLQAWVAQHLPTYEGMEGMIQNAKMINTKDMNDTKLRVFAQLERGEQRLALEQAPFTEHDYSVVVTRNQTVNVQADRFQTRFRKSDERSQSILVHDEETGIDFVAIGKLGMVRGRNVNMKVNANVDGRRIISIKTQGPDQPTKADQKRSLTILQALQGQNDLFGNAFLQYIFDPPSLDSEAPFAWPETFPNIETPAPIIAQHTLNDSQERAVKHMLLNTTKSRLTIIQGPPGTGKTTVIAAFVTSAVAAGSNGIWLMAQSNIAVKNIAEKLAKVEFQNWRLLVSEDFHFEWHEHIYGDIKNNIICSSEFRSRDIESKIQGVPVFLCTISMLSNRHIGRFTRANPIKTLVIDEASQITLGSYVYPLKEFPSIYKICMIGDDKQLPPYGAEKGDIRSIFEVDHLRPSVLFLSIQYRMPPLIGDVVSDVVYDGQLQSNPEHPVPRHKPCAWFVHVHDNFEMRHDTSWHNPAERKTILKIAEKLQVEEKEYCIITPYDAQRSFLEAEMKEAGMDWKDRCFNVDSFQGNERDFVVISLVRSRSLGFLDDLRRTNVMLSRCKKGMYIVTSWEFATQLAANTLIGRMAAAWGDEAWENSEVWVNSDHLVAEA